LEIFIILITFRTIKPVVNNGMIKSMTGYGKAVAETPRKKITIEVKSLNSKQMDLNVKLPWLYREKEPEIRAILSQKLARGKIDLGIYFDMLEEEAVPVINKPVVRDYFRQVNEIASELGIRPGEEILSAIMKLPEVLRTEKAELGEEEWTIVKEKIQESAVLLDNYRIEEGMSIERDLRKSLSNILDLLEKIEVYEPDRITKVREKLSVLLSENTGSVNIDRNRFEQELIFYLEKFDINEEKVRLRRHCEYFLETIDSESPNGKVLSFITQEMGREINTTGSKANDADIQKLVVMMKDELEKIKEQCLNIL